MTIGSPSRGRPRPARALALLGVSFAALALAGGARAEGPRGGTVVRGAAQIARTEAVTTIRQSSERAVIDWRRFDVGRGHRVEFDQPGRGSATLNRVQTARPSLIEGAVRAPGTVVIQNGAGVIFTEDARIDTGGLVATSQAIDADRFQRDGGLRIGGGERGGARVVNRGEITVGEAGLAALVGSDLENTGAIVARRGTVALAGGTRTTIDLAGDGVLRIAVDGDTGRVVNSGRIDAGGGRVVLTAGQAARTLDAAINTNGVIRAGSGSGRGGSIEISGRGGAQVRVSGTLAADGATRGGSVTVVGERTIIADGARISARGGTAGGFVETSGRDALAIGAEAVVTAGLGGFWLLDPRDVIIGNAGSPTLGGGTVTPPAGSGYYRVSIVALQNALDAGSDVTVTTAQPDSGGAGDIFVERQLAWTGLGSLRLVADRDISIDAPILTAGGNFSAEAARNLAVGADVSGTGAAEIALTALGGDLWVGRPSAGDIAVTTESGALSLQAPQGEIVVHRINDGDHGTGIRIDSAEGALGVSAGEAIRIEGGDGSGQWVRVGTQTGAGEVTLEAPRIDVLAGTGGFAEVVTGTGGSLSLRGDEITVRDAPEHDARIAARGGAALSLEADRQTWAGAVESGTGGSDGGDVHLSGAISATVRPLFSLAPGADFVLAAASPGGTPSSYVSGLALSVSTGGSGTVSLGGPVTAQQVTVVSQERVRLEAAARVTGTGPGNAVVVAAGRHLENAAGLGALAAPAGRWLAYIDSFDGLDGAHPDAGNFDLYGRTYASTPPAALGYAGNRVVWGERPVLTLTAETLRKTYGQTAAPGYIQGGLRPGDSLATALSSGPNVSSPGTPARASARSYRTRVAATASGQGYLLDLVNGTLTVDPASLTVTADDAGRDYGALDPVFAGRIDGFLPGDDATLLGGALAFSTDATASSPVDTYAITPSGLTVPGGNYAITYVPGTLAVQPAPLTVTALDAARNVGEPNPAFAVRYGGFVLGEDARALGGTLDFSTDAVAQSPAGQYGVTPAGLTSGNYAISFRPGTLTVQPPQPVAPEAGPARSAGAYAFPRGVPPLTPGDASFRTTIAEAPPALANPFDLTYSLGDIVELAPAGATPSPGPAADTQGFVPAAGGDTQGFVPAAGGSAPQRPDGACAGSVGRGADGCGRRRVRENYWGATAEAEQ